MASMTHCRLVTVGCRTAPCSRSIVGKLSAGVMNPLLRHSHSQSRPARATTVWSLSRGHTQCRGFHAMPPPRNDGIDRHMLKLKLKKPKPTGNSQRHVVRIDRSELWKGRPVRQLTKGLRSKGGRNNHGRITVRGRGGGHKRLYRFIDFRRKVGLDMPGVVQRLEYDPNRSAYIALLQFPDQRVSYIIAPHELRLGDTVMASRTQEIDARPGNAMPLAVMPIGTVCHNIEIKPGHGGQMARAAGTSVRLLAKDVRPGYALLENPSKEQRLVLMTCLATVGTVSNPLHMHRVLGKAGRKRWLGRRPKVRGVAMNPIDHPHGGGEGKAKGRPSSTPWGKPTKGYPTRNRAPNPLVLVKRGGIKRAVKGNLKRQKK